MVEYLKYQMDFHGKKVLDKSSNWTLIGWKDAYENLRNSFLPFFLKKSTKSIGIE